MADNTKKNIEKLNNISDKSSTLVKGTTLDKDSSMRTLVNQMAGEISKDFGKVVKGSIVNYWNEVSVRDVYTNVIQPNNKNKYKSYSEYMEKEGMQIIGGMIEANRALKNKMENYRAIANYIPECARAKEILKTNIISPDDYTKKALDVIVEHEDGIRVDEIKDNAQEVIKKYEIEDLVDKVVDNVLVDSVVVVSVQSLDEEFVEILKNMQTDNNVLTETIRHYDVNRTDIKLKRSDAKDILNESDYKILSEHIDFGLEKGETIKDLNGSIDAFYTNFINENVIIGSAKEKLTESAELKIKFLHDDLSPSDIVTKRKPGRPKKNEANIKTLGLHGSVINILPAENVIEVKKDNMIYGYYLVESIDCSDMITTHDKLNKISPPGSLSFVNQIDINSQISNNDSSEGTAKNIASILAKGIAKKIDAKFLQNNNEFKLQIYEIMKDSDIGKKDKLKITFYDTNEIVMWRTESIFEKVEFFAKLYLAILTNNILLTLGRGQDKRVFYVDTGLDKNYEAAIQGVIRDIKQKEIKSDTFADVNTILQLNPGAFHDYFIPTINGDKPIQIDTLQGMNQNVNTEFTDWLKEAILNGLPVPKTMIDASAEVEFSRSVSAQNGMFCREVIDYQKELSRGFQKLIRLIYRNEYYGDQYVEFDIDLLSIKFPSPLTLNMNNILDMFATATQLAENVSNCLIVDDEAENANIQKKLLMSEIIKDYVPIINWDKYKAFIQENVAEDLIKEKLLRKFDKQNSGGGDADTFEDPYVDPTQY